MLGSILSAAASIGSSLLGKSQADKNAKLQKQFAQEGVQWKVADAKKAGIHPLYALGAQTHSFTPSGVGDWTAGIGQAGQDIGRAIDATQSTSQRADSFTRQYQTLQLQNMGLQNEMLASRIATIKQAGHPPPAPGDQYMLDGQVQSGVKTNPLKIESSAPGNKTQEASTVHELGFMRGLGDTYSPVKSKDATDRLEDDHIGNFIWSLRNRVLPSIGINQNPPNLPVPKGYDAWAYNPIKQAYEPVRFPKFLGKYGKYFAY